MNRIVKSAIQVLLLTAGIYLLVSGYLAWNLRTITDVDDYPDVLEQWKPELVRHFPRQVPGRSGNARFSFFPGFLQGGAHIQLRLSASPEAVEKQISACSEKAIRVVDLLAGEDEPLDAESADAVPYPPFHTHSGLETLRFPPRFSLYYLVARPGKTVGFPWNHGTTAGLAVSRQPAELVYWAESW